MYCLDADGNQIAVGIIVEGNFTDSDNAVEIQEGPDIVAIQEECVTTEQESMPSVEEMEIKTEEAREESINVSKVRKYKIGNRSGKKIKRLEEKLQKLRSLARKQKSKMINKPKSMIERNKNVKLLNPEAQVRKGKAKDNTRDKPYAAPHYIKKQSPPSRCI